MRKTKIKKNLYRTINKINNIIKKQGITLILIIILIIFISATSVLAAYKIFAKDVEYKNNDGTTENVEQALNNLYKKAGEKEYLYNETTNKFSTAYGGYSGWEGKFTEENYNGKKCLKYYAEEYNSWWSCAAWYICDIGNITKYKSLTIKYEKIYSSSNYISHCVVFQNGTNNLDVIPLYDTSNDIENKTITLDLTPINVGTTKILIGVQTGVAKDNVYSCFVNGSNNYQNGYNGIGYGLISEVYLTKK